MSQPLLERICAELNRLPLIDPHTHINPLAPASRNLADLMGYHYYTELAHSAGLPRERIEEPGLSPKEKVSRLVSALRPLENTVQSSWLVELCRTFFGFEETRITGDNWESLYDAAERKCAQPDWAGQVLAKSRLEAVFLTNDFDDPLEGFDTATYIPCLRVDELVFLMQRPEVRSRLEAAGNATVGNAATFRAALETIFRRFVQRGARACAISLPPDFEPTPVSDTLADRVLAVWTRGPSPLAGSSATAVSASEYREFCQFAFWAIAEKCAEFGLPFDLMIGVNRRVYEAGVYQGQDLFDQRCSLIAYRKLFNAFPNVPFPVSVLSHGNNQELVSYSWIFPNVLTSGHWWYSNIPAYIEPDLRARLQAVPMNKQIGYYSDMYKLEFGLPKFNMFRRVLAKVLANDFVVERGWTEEQALELGRTILRGNVERWFPARS